MSRFMRYKGYFGSSEFSPEDRVFHGKLEFIRSLVTYEATDVEGLMTAFEQAVDDYLATCEEAGLKPEKPFRGSFNVRTGSDVHRRAVIFAQEHGRTLNDVVVEALDKYITETA